jgi:hypothetical protein
VCEYPILRLGRLYRKAPIALKNLSHSCIVMFFEEDRRHKVVHLLFVRIFQRREEGLTKRSYEEALDVLPGDSIGEVLPLILFILYAFLAVMSWWYIKEQHTEPTLC